MSAKEYIWGCLFWTIHIGPSPVKTGHSHWPDGRWRDALFHAHLFFLLELMTTKSTTVVIIPPPLDMRFPSSFIHHPQLTIIFAL